MKTLNNNDLTGDSIKIVLIGLDNSGKTSILKCLKGIKRLSAFNSPMPTKGVDVQEFEALNSKYAIWDLGGQKTYLDDYFNDFSKYIKGANKIIYVIDIQDVNRYDLAIKYLKKVINLINKQIDIGFSIFLHKFDPDIEFNQDLNQNIIDMLIKKIKNVTPPNLIYSLHKTTIYTIFEKLTIT